MSLKSNRKTSHAVERSGDALLVGLVAASAAWLAAVTKAPVWLLFLSWVAYFIFGPGWRPAAWATLHMLLGLFLGLIVLRLNMMLEPGLGQWALVGLVLIVATLLALLERAPPMNNIPAYYLGAIAMFAANTPPDPMRMGPLCAAVMLGFLFGWTTVFLRTRFAARFTGGNRPATP